MPDQNDPPENNSKAATGNPADRLAGQVRCRHFGSKPGYTEYSDSPDGAYAEAESRR